MYSPESHKQDLFHVMNEKSEEESYSFFSKRDDDYRSPLAYEDGGITCDDKKQIEKLRSVGKEMVKQIGRKILSG